MKAPFFTADPHLNHGSDNAEQGIILYTKRPFKNIHHMNDEIVRRWNEVVPPNGLTYVLGDLIWGVGDGYGTKGVTEILDRLNGQIFLIEGSHDKPAVKLIKQGYTKLVNKITQQIKVRVDKQDVVLNHYCMRTWERSHFDSWHLFGHSHNRLEALGKSLDVGVDGHNFYPWTWDEIVEYMKTRPHNFNYIETFGGRSL